MPPGRLQGWLERFVEAHGPVTVEAAPTVVVITAADGEIAQCRVPLPPLRVSAELPFGGLVDHAVRERRVGVLLVRRGGYAAGVFDGDRLLASKVGSRHVQGRTAAGGRSQQRFARRREKQAREAFEAAADVAARILLPGADTLDAVIVGGDRPAVTQVLADRRLEPLRALVVPPHLAVPDPKHAVLAGTPAQFRSTDITVSAGPA